MDNSLLVEFKSCGFESLTISIYYFLSFVFIYLFACLDLLFFCFKVVHNGYFRYEYGKRLCIKYTHSGYIKNKREKT